MHPVSDPRVQLLAELADETRYAVLERLERGPASASALAQRLGVSPTQLANHLRRLRDAGLVTVSHRGRLAVYELGEPGLREIFSMLNGLRGAAFQPGREVPAAATCYDHLAGRLGVALMDHLVEAGAVQARVGEGELTLGSTAEVAFAKLGVAVPAVPPRRMLAYACMDSLAGRPHLGGELGAQLAGALCERDWLVPSAEPRRMELTAAGRRALRRHGIRLDPS
ncbi:MAG: metalloregulator ArsR/SmtB family transcription factor [Solirubrobacteraceae bacterium]